jgi:hypothetical protein
MTSPAPGVPNAYAEHLLALLGRQDPLEVLSRMIPSLEARVAGLSEADLRRPEKPGKWSIVQVLAHLADSDHVQGYRWRLMLAEDEPTIQPYDQDRWAAALKYEALDPSEAFDEFRALRTRNLRLARSLSPAELNRTCLHPERGRETIEYVLRLVAGHDVLHLNQIDRIKRASSGGP